MRPDFTLAQAAANIPTALAGVRPAPVDHSEKFIAFLAVVTSSAICQDIGATCEYHGQRVSCE
ncbi:MAG: hypothetical protein ABFD86_16000 [Bryobacteraceae bacterium]